MRNRAKTACSLREGPRSSDTHDDEVSRQISREVQDAVCNCSRFYDHLWPVKQFGFGRDHVAQAIFVFLNGKMWRVAETSFDDVYKGEMRFILVRQRQGEFESPHRNRGEIRCANHAVNSVGGQCCDVWSDSEHRARRFSNHLLSDRTEGHFAPACAADRTDHNQVGGVCLHPPFEHVSYVSLSQQHVTTQTATSERAYDLIQGVSREVSSLLQDAIYQFGRSKGVRLQRYDVSRVELCFIPVANATANGKARLADTSKSVANRMFLSAICCFTSSAFMSPSLYGSLRETDFFRNQLLLVVFHSQIVLHREHTGHAISLHSSDLLLHLARRDAFQLHVAIVHDDVNRRNGTKLILPEHAIVR